MGIGSSSVFRKPKLKLAHVHVNPIAIEQQAGGPLRNCQLPII